MSPGECVTQVGFEPEEALIPAGPRSFQGYRLLQEYFAFPERFNYVRIGGLREGVAKCDGELIDVTVTATREQACAANSCVGFGAGSGVIAIDGAAVTLDRFRIADNALAGVQIVRAELDLSRGEVTGHPIGTSVIDAPDYDVNRLYDRVVFDNTRNFDTSELPIPDKRPLEQ